MKGKTHVIGGLALGYLAFENIEILNVNLDVKTVFITANIGLIIGALLPDIDHEESMLSLRIKPISFITSKLFKHRVQTHSIIGSISMILLIGTILNLLRIEGPVKLIFLKALSIGIASHILFDMLTFKGVALFYPFTKKRIRLIRNLYIPSTVEWGVWEIIIFLLSSGVIYRFVI